MRNEATIMSKAVQTIVSECTVSAINFISGNDEFAISVLADVASQVNADYLVQIGSYEHALEARNHRKFFRRDFR